MSWAAHDLEPYAIQKHSRLKIAFVPLLIGSYSPDLMTKWYVYGIHLGGWDLKAPDPAQFHRGWPGFGFTHSFLYGAVVCLIFWKGFGSKTWGISFMIGQWAHALTDAGDTVGTMLLFPWTHHFSVGAWAYAGQTGRTTDAAAYFSGLGGMWDLVWIVYGFFAWQDGAQPVAVRVTASTAASEGCLSSSPVGSGASIAGCCVSLARTAVARHS